jgi:hypothetical protein
MHVSHKDWLAMFMPICKLAECLLRKWDASSTRAQVSTKNSLQTRSLLSFARAITLFRKNKRQRFKVVYPRLLTNGYLHPIIRSASGDILFNDLMQSSLSFKFDFQFLHSKWGKRDMACQSWQSLELSTFFILITCIRDGKSKQSIIMCTMSLDSN